MTSHAVNNVLAELFRRPDVLHCARARAAAAEANPTVFDGFVFEALRFNPAFPYFFRIYHHATEMAGGTPLSLTVEPGTTVLAATHSAMFDEAAFPDPERFDEVRAQSDAFTFGQGLHECLGRVIAAGHLRKLANFALT